jgi:peptide/nickel transport system ATP-binding protein
MAKLDLLQELKDTLGMSYLFASQEPNVVRLLCDRVIVMRADKIASRARPRRCSPTPKAQYTRELLAAIPHPRFEQRAEAV